MPVATPHPTAEALIEAGLSLAETKGLGQMSVDDIVAGAGVAKGTFYVHFRDRAAYLVTLHRRFHDHLEELVLRATAGMTPGRERLLAGTAAYLDGCLGGKAIKALLLESRSEPLVSQEVGRRNARFAQIASQDFAGMGWSAPSAAGRLFVAMGAEAALAELDARGPVAEVRGSLRQFVSA